MSASGQTVGKVPKHLEIYDRVNCYSKLVDDFDRLLGEIRGAKDGKFEPMDDTAKTPEGPNPSLAEFLVNEADRIETINKHFQEIMLALRSELF